MSGFENMERTITRYLRLVLIRSGNAEINHARGLTAEMASMFSGIVLSNVTREYPNKWDPRM